MNETPTRAKMLVGLLELGFGAKVRRVPSWVRKPVCRLSKKEMVELGHGSGQGISHHSRLG